MTRNMPQKQQPTVIMDEGAALAAEIFDHFCSASTMRQCLGLYRKMCDTIGLRPEPINDFYPKLKEKIKNWKAQALWKKFDARASHRVYNKGTACTGTRVLVIGAGPCGLRSAIEAQLLGAKVVVVEKRDRISRNNVLHLWPFVITDLKALGAKKFYGKFCAGSIDHISIRQLQCMLLKVALLLGVEVHEGVSFNHTIEPTDGCGWRADVSPDDHAVSHYEYDVLIGADGKRNTLEGFKRKEFRGKLAIAITANFINRKSEAEARVEEISGVAFIFNQSFFKELYHTTGIDLENIVYYKDETHYFVMTAKKHSLIDKGVIVQDYTDPAELLASHNVNTEKLLDYAREAAEFSTKYQMPNLEFAVNHYGKPDVAMFDFTSMFAAENSCRVTVKKNYRLLSCLVGDSLLEPFWPTGSGCARGFLSSMDAAYACKLFANPRNSILAVMAQRESIYRLLAQTTPENLHRDIGAYTLDPVTRYPNLNKTTVLVHQIKHLLISDDQSLYEQTYLDTNALQALPETMGRRKRRTADSAPLGTVLLRWIKSHLKGLDFVNQLTEAPQCFTDGRVIVSLINRYRPDLVDLNVIQELTPEECNEKAFAILEHELGIPRVMSPNASIHLEQVDSKLWLNYLEQICEVFRGEIPHVKHPKLDFDELKQRTISGDVLMAQGFSRLHKLAVKKANENLSAATGGVGVSGLGGSSLRKMSIEDDNLVRKIRKSNLENRALSPVQQQDLPRRAKKRRSHDKIGNIDERLSRLTDIESNRVDRQNRRRMQRAQQTENFFKSLHMLQANTFLRESDSSSPFEDYSIYMYRQSAPQFNDRVKEMEQKLKYPDRERGIMSAIPRGHDGQFSDRIKSMEQQIKSKNSMAHDKKPKDLLRAIGKIESNDWNVKQIERKMELSKKTTDIGKSREKVPKWNREQFLARQHKMAKADRQESVDEKYKDIDNTLKSIDKQLKEGHTLEIGERGKNKVASIAGQFKKKDDSSEEKSAGTKNAVVPKAGLVLTSSGISEVCHFCKQRVYLMEKISPEGLVCHRSCLKCHHCHTNLRMGGYAFDRDNSLGLFYCTQHFRLLPKEIKMPAKRHLPRLSAGKPAADIQRQPQQLVTPEKQGIATLDLLDRGQTPERIEFENADAMSDGEPSLENIIDENEWTDRNFGTGSEESDDLSSSNESDSDSDSDIYDDPIGSPLGAAQTLQLASDWIDKRYSTIQDSDDEFYEYSTEDEDADSQTEGEELARAREIRMQEVKLMPPPILPTDTETEAQTDSETSSPELNSATEISTDSEFDHDPIMRTPPKIFIDDSHLKKPTRVQVKQSVIENGLQHRPQPPIHQALNHHTAFQFDRNIHLEFKPLVEVDPTIILSSNRQPLKNPRPGNYDLTKTASTEGIASKKSLELKKRYLLGETGNGMGVLKSGSASALDTKFKSFHSNISECQKLLNNHPTSEQPLSPKLPPLMINGLQTTITTTTNKELENKNLEEKENVYNGNNNHNTNKKNNINDIIDVQIMKKSLDYLETVNTALVENKLKEILTSSPTPTTDASASQNGKSQKLISTINLITPEKDVESKKNKIIDLAKIDISEAMVNKNKDFIMDKSDVPTTPPPTPLTPLIFDAKSRFRTNFIDLTMDSPILDRSLVETRVNFSMQNNEPTAKANEKPGVKSPTANETLQKTIAAIPPPDILSNLNFKNLENQQRLQQQQKELNEKKSQKLDVDEEEERSRSPAQDTSIVVPTLWKTTSKSDDDEEKLESDSMSSSTTSSIGDIPHFILDSTTSPETQNGILVPPPRLEFHDHDGELMQMESLVLVDKNKVEREDKTITPTVEVLNKETKNEMNESSSNSNSLVGVQALVAKPPTTPTPTNHQARPRYEGNYKKHGLKFDTNNQQKGETMKNIPFVKEPTPATVSPQSGKKIEKPTILNLPKINQQQVAHPELATPDHKDEDKTPMNHVAPDIVSDSETEFTGQVLTETELSDWTADDAVSENFVDMEFVLNSNKGTIKRNKKSKKKSTPANGSGKLLHANNHNKQHNCGILKNLDIEEIEFMDTGSENESCATPAATNKAVLKNHGYVEFVETNGYNRMITVQPPKNLPLQLNYSAADRRETVIVEAVNIEVAGIDYIEQGNCILEAGHDDPSLKTPMNEEPTRSPFKFDLTSSTTNKFQQPLAHGLPQQGDSFNEIEDDSLIMISSQGTMTTTEESDALTVVTSPLDSLPPTKNSFKSSTTTNSSTTTSTTPTDHNDNHSKTLSSSPRKPSSNSTAINNNSISAVVEKESRRSSEKRKDSLKNLEDIGYEEYVKRLQLKIAQISNSPRNAAGPVSVESIDATSKKSRRKTSKGDLLADQPVQQSVTSIYVDHKLAAPPNLNKKLEEITKERVKQKDIIHDLVMDKLQTKKILNAEKRLNRSRTRNACFSPGTTTSSTSQFSSVATTPVTASSICNNYPHYHATEQTKPTTITAAAAVVEHKPPSPQHKIIRSNTVIATPVIIGKTYKSNMRPLSDNLDKANITPNLMKTKSFSMYSTNVIPSKPATSQFTTPLPPQRGGALAAASSSASTLTMTEKLKDEARARAKLLTNRDLGLSPEEKLQLLRKKYQQQMSQELYGVCENERQQLQQQQQHKHHHHVHKLISLSPDDMKCREKKMMSSKSVNDIVRAAASSSSSSGLPTTAKSGSIMISSNEALNLNAIRNGVQRNPDFTSDPNLSADKHKQLLNHPNLRRKDLTTTPTTPERRKSIIRTVSDFFHKKRDHSKDGERSTTTGTTSSKEGGSTSKHESSVFGMFSRLSPKSKEKSKDKENSPMYEKSQSVTCLKKPQSSPSQPQSNSSSPLSKLITSTDEEDVPPVPPLPLNYQRSDDESYPASESKNELKKLRAITKATKQAELKRLRIAQEIQREQEEIEVHIKALEERGVRVEKALRGEGENLEKSFDEGNSMGANDENLLKELLEILRNITQFKKRDEELGIRQQELQLEHRHAVLKEQLNMRLSCNKLDKSSSDVAAEGKILNEMLDIVSKRAALRPSTENLDSDI